MYFFFFGISLSIIYRNSYFGEDDDDRASCIWHICLHFPCTVTFLWSKMLAAESEACLAFFFSVLSYLLSEN